MPKSVKRGRGGNYPSLFFSINFVQITLLITILFTRKISKAMTADNLSEFDKVSSIVWKSYHLQYYPSLGHALGAIL